MSEEQPFKSEKTLQIYIQNGIVYVSPGISIKHFGHSIFLITSESFFRHLAIYSYSMQLFKEIIRVIYYTPDYQTVDYLVFRTDFNINAECPCIKAILKHKTTGALRCIHIKLICEIDKNIQRLADLYQNEKTTFHYIVSEAFAIGAKLATHIKTIGHI